MPQRRKPALPPEGVVSEATRPSAGWDELVEREHERETIELASSAAARGGGRFVVVYGQAGIGRSSLLAAAVADAGSHGLAALEARGSELERGYGFGVVRQLLEARVVALPASEQRAIFEAAGPAAAAALGIPSAHGAVVARGFEQIEAVHRVLVRLARDSPLLVAVDDLQWCDRPSLDVICFLGHRVAQLPITIVTAWRRGEPGVRAGRLQALAAMPQTSFLTPAPLTPTGVASAIRRATGRSPSEAHAVYEQTGGQPFLVAEVAEGLRLRGLAGDAATSAVVAAVTPESVRRNVASRLGRHAESIQRLARAVAVIGEGSGTDAAAVAGLEQEKARAAAAALVRAGIFRDDSVLAYAQPVVRRAVYDSLSSMERADLHGQAATRLFAAVAASEHEAVKRVATHLLCCEPVGDPRFADVLRHAAQLAAEAGAHADARRFLERALGEPTEPRARAEVLLRLAQMELWEGDVESSRRHASESLALADSPAERAVATLGCARAAAAGDDGDTAVALRLLDREQDALRTHDRVLAARVRASATALRILAGLPAAAHESPPAVAAAKRALDGVGPAVTVVDLARRALAGGGTGDADDGVAFRYLAGHAALVADGCGAVADFLSQVAPMPDPDGAVATLALRSQLALAAGELASAATASREGIVLLERLTTSPLRRRLRADLLLVRGFVQVERGFVDTAARSLARVPKGPATAHAACLDVAVALARGRPAPLALADAPEGVVAPGCRVAAWAALAAHGAGDAPEALALATENLAFARRWQGPTVLGRALVVRAVVERGRKRLELLDEAVATLRESSARLELARALVELGSALRRARLSRDARVHLMQGADLAHACGADVLLGRARAELVASGARPRRGVFSGVDSLTSAERRVADLAAAGMTNREIANELYVSAKTVSGQLTSVYLKLDVHDRAALAAAMHKAGCARTNR